MEYPNEVKITNFNIWGNLHRNTQRPTVDEMFTRAEQLNAKYKYNKNVDENLRLQMLEKAKDLQLKARQLWRKIVTEAETLK